MSSDVLVSARISQGKKDAAKSVLESLGSTTSDLINSAFDYLLENKELPQSAAPKRPTKAEVKKFLASSSYPVDWGDDAADGDYKKLLHEGKREAYESLA